MTAEEIIKAGLYEVAVILMDEELREQIHGELAPCTERDFLQAYMEAHRKKYGIDFII